LKFKRRIYKELQEWKSKSGRKPLIVRGARQVGKSTIIKQFAKEYSNSILLNLEKPNDRRFFEEFDDVSTIVDALFFKYNIDYNNKGDVLLFIDEIQESAKAIEQLRYFHEEIPELHIIAAGSLLEFVISEIKNFPVARVEYLYMSPLNFQEYLEAIGQSASLKIFQQIPIPDYAHSTLTDLFNKYCIIGGMPEIVSFYIENRKLSGLQNIYESIWETYKNDVEKYGSNNTLRKIIKHVISSAHYELDKRIRFHNFGNSNYRSREVGEAMRNLDDARIIRLIYPTTCVEPPAIPDLKKSPRLQFLDTGILNYSLGIQSDLLSLKDLSNAYRGALIPHIITQELISLNLHRNIKPLFWVREKSQSSAEVDLIYVYHDLLIPIEIKSGASGKLKSLHQYINISPHPYAVRIYSGSFSIEHHKTQKGKDFILMNIPYYLGTCIGNYIEYMVSNY
jgi:predicted AAA+ superfamily ATPase